MTHHVWNPTNMDAGRRKRNFLPAGHPGLLRSGIWIKIWGFTQLGAPCCGSRTKDWYFGASIGVRTSFA